jgi:membrane fusion protein, multidrug efflux system
MEFGETGVQHFKTLLACSCVTLALHTAAMANNIQQQQLDCLIESNSQVKVGAAVSGTIAKIFVDRGDHVGLGQPLFELQSDVEKAEYEIAKSKAENNELVAAAQAQLELAKANSERMTKLRSSNSGALNETQLGQAVADAKVAENNLRNAEANQKVALLEVERANAVLAERTVLSPIEGVVLERTMAPGEYRNDQASVLTLVALDPLYVETYIPKEFFGLVSLGNTATVTIEKPLGTTHSATVTVVDPVVDAASGTFGVRLSLPNANYKIPAGLRCQLQFD